MKRQRTVLVLEDAYLVACDIAQTLCDHGYEVDVIASDTEEALEYLSEACPGFAVLDLNLGHGDTSLRVARRLSQLCCPYIFLTGYSRENFSLPSDLTNTRWIAKPFSEQQLIGAMKELA